MKDIHSNKKIWLLVSILATILVVMAIVVSFVSNQTQEPLVPIVETETQLTPPVQPETSDTTDNAPPQDITVSQIVTTAPTPIAREGDIFIGEMPVKDFYKFSQNVEDGIVTITKRKDYSLLYSEEKQEFAIFVTEAENPIEAQLDAENLLQIILGLNKPNMCRLSHQVTFASNLENEYSGKTGLFSFCT